MQFSTVAIWIPDSLVRIIGYFTCPFPSYPSRWCPTVSEVVISYSMGFINIYTPTHRLGAPHCGWGKILKSRLWSFFRLGFVSPVWSDPITLRQVRRCLCQAALIIEAIWCSMGIRCQCLQLKHEHMNISKPLVLRYCQHKEGGQVFTSTPS